MLTTLMVKKFMSLIKYKDKIRWKITTKKEKSKSS